MDNKQLNVIVNLLNCRRHALPPQLAVIQIFITVRRGREVGLRDCRSNFVDQRNNTQFMQKCL